MDTETDRDLLEAAGPTAEELLNDFFGEAADGVMCSIYETRGARKDQRSFLFKFELAPGFEASELFERVLEAYGPGSYELRAKDIKTHQFVDRKVFDVGSERDRLAALMPKRETPGAGKASQSEISPELRAILESQQRILEQLAERQAAPAQSPVESLRELMQLKELFGPAAPAQQPTPVSEVISLVKDVLALKSELADEDTSANPLAAALKHFAPAINSAVEKLGETPQFQNPERATPAAPERAPLNGDTGAMPMDLNGLFSKLYEIAQASQPADDAAQTILEHLATQPEWIESLVLNMIADERERVVGRIVGSYPKLAPYRAWLTEVVLAILSAIEAADADDDDDKPEPDAANDAPGKNGSQPNAGSS